MALFWPTDNPAATAPTSSGSGVKVKYVPHNTQATTAPTGTNYLPIKNP